MKTPLSILLLLTTCMSPLCPQLTSADALDQGDWPMDGKMQPCVWSEIRKEEAIGFGTKGFLSHHGFCVHPKQFPLETSSSQSTPIPNILQTGYSEVTENGPLAANKAVEKRHSNNTDHHYIVALESDPTVMQATNSLFQRHPSKSTLLIYHKGALQIKLGSLVQATRKSRVWMVGHGSFGSNGAVRLGGQGPKEIAKLVAGMATKSRHIQMVYVVGCYLGKEETFAKDLLQLLKVHNVETQLQLFTSAVSVTLAGEQLTGEEDVWRLRDGRSSVFVRLDVNGNLLVKHGSKAPGEVVLGYKGKALYVNRLDWPSQPQMFVPADLRKKYPYINCLEGLTWSLFFEEHGNRRAPDFDPGNLEAVWLNNSQVPDSSSTVSFKHITTILDLLCEIRINAIEDANVNLYYVLNNYIYKFHRRTLRTALVGVFISPADQLKVQRFISAFEIQAESYSLHELREGLQAADFVYFCRQTFQLRQCDHNCDLWGRYFMAAVFSASVRNFRTFSLFLMTTIACEVRHSQGSDDSICRAFVGEDYPMSRREPGQELARRGFYGGTLAEDDVKTSNNDRLNWLEEVLMKENFLYERSSVLMSGVDHDQNTEVDIFARVKVMNSYVFSSYLEFFRGTEEGRRLKRGCVSHPIHDKP